MTAAALWHAFLASPWTLAYAAGCLTGWNAARRVTRYMVVGR